MTTMNKIAAGISAAIVTVISGIGIVSAVTPAVPALPADQQALVTAGYTRVADWGKFEKKQGGCTVTVIKSGANYYVSTKGGFASTLYPVRPAHVVTGANFLLANCQA